jgi:gas vesicle structural protein
LNVARRVSSLKRRTAPIAERVLGAEDASVLDLLDRLLDKGVTAHGDVMLGIAGVDLIYVRLAALLCAADRLLPSEPDARRRPRRRRFRVPESR